MEYLIAVDLEGVNNVVGNAYSGLGKDIPDYKVAVEQAVLEINAAVKALFDGGATKVVVWDNHGGSKNIDFTKVDNRVIKIDQAFPSVNRYEFCKNYNFKGQSVDIEKALAIVSKYLSKNGNIYPAQQIFVTNYLKELSEKLATTLDQAKIDEFVDMLNKYFTPEVLVEGYRTAQYHNSSTFYNLTGHSIRRAMEIYDSISDAKITP